jgi:hypothetical protein
LEQLTQEAIRHGQHAQTPGDAIAFPSPLIQKRPENEIWCTSRRQQHERHHEGDEERDVHDSTHQLERRQDLDAPDIRRERDGQDRPHDQRPLPAFNDIVRVIDDEQTLDLRGDQIEDTGRRALPCKNGNPSCNPRTVRKDID